MPNILAKDVHLHLWDPDAGPAAYVEITDLQTVSPPLPAWQFEEVTPLDTAERARRNKPTLHDLGVLGFTYLHDETKAGHALVRSVGEAGTNPKQQFKLDFPGVLGGFEFYGYVQDFQFPTAKGAHIKPSFNIKVDRPMVDVVPEIVSVEVVEDANYPDYETGHVIRIKVTFSENVYFVDGGTNPGVTLDIDGSAAAALYVSGSGSNEWFFEYEFVGGDAAALTEFAIESPLVLNDGTIKDFIGQAVSPLTFTPPDAQTDVITVTDTS
jgi:hypothetical protein